MGWGRSEHTAGGALMITSWLQFVLVPAPPRCPPPEIFASECERRGTARTNTQLLRAQRLVGCLGHTEISSGILP
jgi:hypothetical protein